MSSVMIVVEVIVRMGCVNMGVGVGFCLCLLFLEVGEDVDFNKNNL